MKENSDLGQYTALGDMLLVTSLLPTITDHTNPRLAQQLPHKSNHLVLVYLAGVSISSSTDKSSSCEERRRLTMGMGSVLTVAQTSTSSPIGSLTKHQEFLIQFPMNYGAATRAHAHDQFSPTRESPSWKCHLPPIRVIAQPNPADI